MASSSDGVEWICGVIPILTSPQLSVNKSDIPHIVKSVLQSQQTLLNHDESSEGFFAPYVALCSHCIITNATQIPKSQIVSTAQACRVLLHYLLQKLQKFSDQSCLLQKQIMTLIQGLCKNSCSLQKADVITLSTMLKSAKVPTIFGMTCESQDNKEEIKQPKRPRLDPSISILEQLMTPVIETPGAGKAERPIEMVDKDGDTTIIHIRDPGQETKSVLLAKNINSLQQLGGGDVLLNMCLSLPSIQHFVSQLKEALSGKGLKVPTCISGALPISNSYKSIMNDISIVWRALSLPVLEPLMSDRVEKLSLIALSCLYASVAVTASCSILGVAGTPQSKGVVPLKEDENDNCTVGIVETSLEIYNAVASAMQTSTRAGGCNLQNLHLAGSWLLFSGLQSILNMNPSMLFEKAKEQLRVKSTPEQTPTKAREQSSGMSKQSLLKIQQGFGVLCVALSTQAITLVTALLEDLKAESISTLSSAMVFAGSQQEAASFEMEPLGQYSAWQRVQKLTSTVNLTHILFGLASASYRKAGMLKRIQKHPVDGDVMSTSDSNTYYEDDFSSSEDSSGDDDDSEPILGQWFEETVAPRESSSIQTSSGASGSSTSNVGGNKATQQQVSHSTSLVPEKGEPHGYISLASKIFRFLNNYFVSSDITCIKDYLRNTLSESQMITLAGIIKDLDRETSRIESGNIGIIFGAVLGQLYEEFSRSLSRFIHNLLATGLLSECLQSVLLAQLGVSPWTEEPWPLQVYSRTLAVLAQALLLKQQREKDELRTDETACVVIWQRFLDTITKAFLLPQTSTSQDEGEDINVEYAQLLLFLFHNLQLMQKKSVLLMLAQTLIDLAPCVQSVMKDVQIIYLARLLCFFEYMMKNLYDAPSSLVEQVQVNLFSSQMISSLSEKDNNRNYSRLFFSCKEIEDNYTKNSTSDDLQSSPIKPRFYNLTSVEINNQDVPKLDGFALSFILGTPDVLNYGNLYDALVSMLSVGAQCDMPERSEKLSYLGFCAIQYCFSVCWRLLMLLPPSIQFMDALSTGDTKDFDPPRALHALLWVPRCGLKLFNGWIKDALVKQGLTTQKTAALLLNVSKNAGTLFFDYNVAKQIITKHLSQHPIDSHSPVPRDKLPHVYEMFVLEAVIAKLQVSLDSCVSKVSSGNASSEVKQLAQELLMLILKLVSKYTACIRWNVLYQMIDYESSSSTYTALPDEKGLQSYNLALRISSVRCPKMSNFTAAIFGYLPNALRNVLDKWIATSVTTTAWRNDFANDVIPSESYILSIESAHISSLSGQSTFTTNLGLKRVLHTVVRFAGDLIIWCPDNQSSKEFVQVMLPILLEATTDSLVDFTTLALESVTGLPPDSDEFMTKLYEEILTHSYDLIINHSGKDGVLDEKILQECLKLMDSLLDKPAGKKALESFFCHNDDKDMVNILLSAANENLSPSYGTRVLKFFSKLFQQAEKSPGDKTLESLCSSISKLSKLGMLDTGTLQHWLNKVISGTSVQSTEEGSSSIQENRLLLQSITSYIVKENSAVEEEVASALLSALVPMGSQLLSSTSEGMGFSELMVIMATLAGAGSGAGHLQLFRAVITWLEQCKKYLAQKDVLEKIEVNVTTGRHQIMMESVCYLLSYLADVLGALRMVSERTTSVGRSGATSPPCDGELHHPEMDSDWAEELGPDDEESAGEDSDEDSLCNKLCTFTVTQKEFMNQHWYHCHTCKMVDGVGVCTVCAKVCHKDHDVTYSKYGSFFCDCGAKEDNTCQALVKRSPQSTVDSSGTSSASAAFAFSSDTILPSSLRRRPSSPVAGASTSGERASSESRKGDEMQKHQTQKHKQLLGKQLEASKESMVSLVASSHLTSTVMNLLQYIMPAVIKSCQRNSPIGSSSRAQQALHNLHTLEKCVQQVDQLMVPTLGSQEGAFENVRMNYSGEQGQTIRQLISAHMMRRVAMCCLASPQGKRQHLAVSHEKGKITLLQLSALLKQADSSKRKLTLTRLASAPVPFTVISICGNPCNEDFLAVCGLKDCHVLTFSSSGSVAGHLVLHPELEAGNYIIKAIWLPGSQVELAVVTADFVKIYDLSADALSPQFFFLLPSGKIRDCCFVFSEDGQRHMMLISSGGHIYYQPMVEESSAVHGPFYVTNILDIEHPDIVDTNGTINGGGVSIYYSHMLQLLFFSYSLGNNFVAPFPRVVPEIDNLFPIEVKPNNGTGVSGSGKSSPQSLCQWSEVPGHPGLVLALVQSSNNPVVLMIKPDVILVQEIKFLSSKSKITDMVAIRHPMANNETRTTLILLCEDGSLRIYMASQEHTGYWLMPAFQPANIHTSLKPSKKKKSAKSGRPTGAVSFPVDFFEHCSPLTDIEFGGNDVLQVYNTQQVKHRLNTRGMYIANTKPAGFTIEVFNSDYSMVMVGVRIEVGSQDAQRAPSYIEIFGRTLQVSLTRTRWYDFPFTHEESLTADKKLTIFFGASSDPSGLTIVDSIKVYGKTKEAFGWPEDNDEFSPSTGTTVVETGQTSSVDGDSIPAAPLPLTPLDRLISSSLEVLDGCFSLSSVLEEKQHSKNAALDLATQLLLLPTPPAVQDHVKALLATLHTSRSAYNNHRDRSLLKYVLKCLGSFREGKRMDDLDGEAFYRLVAIARGVAVARPSNLVRFSESHALSSVGESTCETAMEVTDVDNEDKTNTARSASLSDSHDSGHFIVQLSDAFWTLHNQRPRNPAIAPVSRGGLVHVEATVQALIEVFHAFTMCEPETTALAAKMYAKMLLCEDTVVSFAAKQAFIRVLRPRLRRRKVFIPSPPHCNTPGEAQMDHSSQSQPQAAAAPPPPQAQAHPQEMSIAQDVAESPSREGPPHSEGEPHFEVVQGLDPMILLPADASGGAGAANLEVLIAGQGGFPVLDIPPDADDETMVELAIALSLQDQPGRSGGLALQDLPMNAPVAQRASSLEGGHYSDTTASAGASDDEGSTAATDGSTLRTSPAEQGGSAGSESGGSGVDSITGEHNVSGRSSAYGDAVPESTTTGARSETSSVGVPSTSMPQEVETLELETDVDTSFHLHSLRLMLLEKFLQYLPDLQGVGGVRAIPFMQVLLMLSSDLDGEEEKDRVAVENLLSSLIAELGINSKDSCKMAERTPGHEVQLVIMRMLSILMSRFKCSVKPSGGEGSTFCSTSTALVLLSSGMIEYCLQNLKVLLDYWKSQQTDDKTNNLGGALKPHPNTPPPDMSPFFLRQYVKGHANDVFEAYPQLLTEMVLRLPYQIKKIVGALPSAPPVVFSQAWYSYLCEYMMMQQAPFVRRQVRKLLLFICGSKDKYRQLRDFHALESHMKSVKALCHQGGFDGGRAAMSTLINLPYDSLIMLIEHLKACSEVATCRTYNWQKFCEKDESVLPFLIHSSFLLDEGVSPIVLQLLQCAICGSKAVQQSQAASGAIPQAASSPAKQRKEKSEDAAEDASKHEETQCMILAQQVSRFIEQSLFSQFLRCFLLESNSTAVRWQAHSLILHLYKNISGFQQEILLDMMWKLWSQLPVYGRKAAQFVDLLGYFTIKTPQHEDKEREYVERALSVLRQQNQLLMNHPNSNIYNSLQGLVEFDGYYLESEPCLVCNNPEVQYTNYKLSALKMDSRFTTTTQIVKLIGSHTISKITLRISDLKRSKMVKVLNIYYNNRSVQSVVELKNRPSVWHKAKKCTLTAGQNELKIDFPLPIVACNLMIEYADFYENIQASSESLQCPRCSASVPANPGVCANCGENVFQCHKCRAINYDEKDPFLCNSCGFCKYAKFEYTLTAKPCCAVDPIENEDDRKKAITSINNLLEKADRAYKQLMANKPALELLLLRIREHGLFEKLPDEIIGSTTSTASAMSTSNVNRAIQQVAQRYCTECKASYEELSKIIQRVLASRKELVEYDSCKPEGRGRAVPVATSVSTEKMSRARSVRDFHDGESDTVVVQGKCYGCASASVEHCITLLRALTTVVRFRQVLCSQGIIRELVEYNLRHGTIQVRHEVRQLLCLLTRDSPQATADLNMLLMDKISSALRGHMYSPDLAAAVRHEIALLANSLQKEDSCWEQRLRCVMQLFLMGLKADSPVVMESITLPCLKILQTLIKPEPPMVGKRSSKERSVEVLSTTKATGMMVSVDLQKWLAGCPDHSYSAWKKRAVLKSNEASGINIKKMKPEEVRAQYLMEKYAQRWRERTKKHSYILQLQKYNWLRNVLFNPASRTVRNVACSIVEALCQVPSRKQEMLDMLTAYLDDLGVAGENAAEFFALYQNLIRSVQTKHYLAVQGLLPHLGGLITKEIEHLTHLEETTLSSDLSQGYALKMLTELLTSFVEVDSIRQHYKSRLLGCVLNGYLSLRKLVVQHTKLIDETQDKLLELLEEMTTGTESETAAFMAVCVETVKKYGLDDLRTPVFIFERLCSVIYPQENDTGEFFITLEKDPQQEDFLQGRMLGNPYSSNEPGMGPLMRDIKNKICQDCELVALLEDDNGMELLVNNKIISLDLPVKDVYKKVWCVNNGEAEAMRVVYRMRGLLGDATEEFIETLDTKDNEEVDNEEVYKMANVMSQCGGLEVMLERLAAIHDLARSRPLLMVLLKLFGYCIKVKSNRQKLIEPSMNTIKTMLEALRLALTSDSPELLQGPPGSPSMTEQLLQIMETVLVEAAMLPIEDYKVFCASCGTKDDIKYLLSAVNTPAVRGSPTVLQLLMRIIPFLTLGDCDKMTTLIDHFKPYLNFNKFDYEHSSEDDLQLECCCMLTSGIERNENGNQLKDLIVQQGIVRDALEYLTIHAPPSSSALLAASDEWKEFTSRPALKYVLKLLTGLSQGHKTTQTLVSAECIPIIHRLEQVSSDERVGSLAENLMEAIKQHPNVAQKIEEVRRQTRDEKKRLAMAMREKQLGALGMRTNEKGQVTAKSALLKQVEDLGEETGLVCIICREGYKFQPTKVLGIYTYTKRCNVDDFENRARKSPGFSTVTHFNVVHVDCHMAAVRHARGRDEWESAALQNANTRCNGLLPLWGPQVPESAFASCLARHNTYLQECTGHRDVGYTSTIHDLKLLLQKFSQERSFSEDSGGGGPQSNMHLIPYIIHMALYVINTTRCASREAKNISNFLSLPPDKWVEGCFEAEGPHYWMAMSLVVYSSAKWSQCRVAFLKRMLVLAQARHFQPQGGTFLSNVEPQAYSIYKPSLIYFGLLDALYNIMFKRVLATSDEDWPLALAEYIRHNDHALLEAGDKVLHYYEEELLPSQSFAEFCDVVGLLFEIPNPDEFLKTTLQSVALPGSSGSQS